MRDTEEIKKEYAEWLELADDGLKAELKMMDDADIEDAFYRDLTFGTGGLRGTIGAGTNRMNVHVVAKASQGLSQYLLEKFHVDILRVFNFYNCLNLFALFYFP